MADKGSTMAQRVDWANKNGVDYYICLHTNAGGGTGTECLYYNHPLSIKANQLVYDELTKLYPSKRGLKDYSHFYENANTRMVSCYPEIAFHDNREDVKFILNNKEAIADALCRGICAFFGVEYKAESTDLRAEIERLEQEIALRDEQTGELHDRIDRLNDEIATREQQTREVEAKVAALKAKAAQLEKLAAEMLSI
jgi:N-acetylmuramoyl-L-alanine amidase